MLHNKNINKNDLYRFPWSKTDNPGGWIEVTDECDLECIGCYRHKIEGHRKLEEIKQEIVLCKELINCDCITIAGGEPLIYPYLKEVVEYINKTGLKSIIFTNGEKLDYKLALELKKAGLTKFHFHIDSGQRRPGWEGKTEVELNALRMRLADIIHRVKGIQCGFHVTVYRKNLNSIPEIVEWALSNISKVQHISFIAYRAIPINNDLMFYVNNKVIEPQSFQNSTADIDEINITTEEMYGILSNKHKELKPCAYLNGTTSYDTFKFLIINNIGSKAKHYGILGSRSVEIAQVFYHLLNRRYFAFLRNPVIGKRIFILSFFDSNIRRALRKFLFACLKNPLRLFDKIYTQSIHFQQPNEIIDGKINLCDDCVNMMVYKGRLINSCRLDEYRIYNEAIVTMKT